MGFHVALHRRLDLEAAAVEAEAGLAPRQAIGMLARRLDATLHEPDDTGRATRLDKLRSRVIGRPWHWALGRSLASRLGPGDSIYCPGEEIGLPIAATCGARHDRPRIVVFINNIDRPRGRLALKLLRAADRIDVFVTNTPTQADFLRRFLRLPDHRVHLIEDQTDTRFFTPGPPSEPGIRPLVAGVGLEQRDYRTLAEATRDLDVDVRISGHSRDAAVRAKAFPESMPANMSQRFYPWPELVQLYRDADVVVLSLFENNYTAGITTLMEATSCRRPLVATRTTGLDYYLAPNIAATVAPGDSAALREAILATLADREAAAARAVLGHQMAVGRFDVDRFVAELAGLVRFP